MFTELEVYKQGKCLLRLQQYQSITKYNNIDYDQDSQHSPRLIDTFVLWHMLFSCQESRKTCLLSF